MSAEQDAEAILNKAWHYPEDAYAAFELLPGLVAEIKQAREQISRLGRLAFFGKDDPVEKIIDHFIQWGDSTFKYLQESKEQLAAKDKEIERLRSLIDLTAHNFLQLQPGITWEGGINDAMKAACEEIKRLRADIDCNQLRTRCWKAEGDCKRWQQAAIEATANKIFKWGLDDTCVVPVDGLEPDFEFKGCSECDLAVCPYRSWWMSEAAKELGLEQEASYVKRLEEKVLDFYECDATRRGCCRQVAQDQARAALTKIRERKK